MFLSFDILSCVEETTVGSTSGETAEKIPYRASLRGNLAPRNPYYIKIAEGLIVEDAKSKEPDSDKEIVIPQFGIHLWDKEIEAMLLEEFKKHAAIGHLTVHHFFENNEKGSVGKGTMDFHIFVSEQRYDNLRAAICRGDASKRITFFLPFECWHERDEDSQGGTFERGMLDLVGAAADGMNIKLFENKYFATGIVGVKIDTPIIIEK